MKIAIDNNLISYLAGIESYLPTSLWEKLKSMLHICLSHNKNIVEMRENLKSLVYICLSHNKNIIDIYIPSTVKGEIYNKKLTGDPEQLKRVFIAMMLKGIDAFIDQEQFDNNYQKFKTEFGKYFNFNKKNDEKDFRIVVESILFKINILITCDNPLIKNGEKKEINKYIKIFTPQKAEYYLLNNYKPYKEFATKLGIS